MGFREKDVDCSGAVAGFGQFDWFGFCFSVGSTHVAASVVFVC